MHDGLDNKAIHTIAEGNAFRLLRASIILVAINPIDLVLPPSPNIKEQLPAVGQWNHTKLAQPKNLAFTTDLRN